MEGMRQKTGDIMKDLVEMEKEIRRIRVLRAKEHRISEKLVDALVRETRALQDQIREKAYGNKDIRPLGEDYAW